MKKHFTDWLDLFRWIAAFVVVISHAGGILLMSLSEIKPEARTYIHYLYSFIAGFAHYAVIIFFVMSGYLVGGGAFASIKEMKFSASNYITKRVVRLWIVLAPALLFSWILIYFFVDRFPEQAGVVYAGRPMQSADLNTLLCNLLFLQNLACDRYAGNNSLWSLFHEFWYYILFPLTAYAITPKYSAWRRALSGTIAIAILAILSIKQRSNVPIAPYYAIWLLGVWSYSARKLIIDIKPRTAILLFLALSTLGRVVWEPTHFRNTVFLDLGWGNFDLSYTADFLIDFLVAIAFANALLVLRHYPIEYPAPLGKRNAVFASFSFSMYCLHMPLLMAYSIVLEKYLPPGFDVTPTSATIWAKVALGLIFSVVFSYAFWWIFERHTDRVRLVLTRRFLFLRPSA